MFLNGLTDPIVHEPPKSIHVLEKEIYMCEPQSFGDWCNYAIYLTVT